MSVEIEVGLENAANMRTSKPEAQKLDLSTSGGFLSPKIRARLIIGAIVLLLAGLFIGALYVKMPRTRRRVDLLGSLGDSYKAWKLRRAKRKFQVYLRKHGSDRDRYIN